mmetsp:Transcript_3555/g.9679  ORF Transcript_3555/g.9679 Transcript_3555/m.9679 type:complete len:136 (+) Transcript_3555:200-607(+)
MVRFKNRYLVIQVQWKGGRPPPGLNEPALLAEVRASLGENFGDDGLGRALGSLQVKFWEPKCSLLIVRCNRSDLREVWCAMTLLTDVRRVACMFRVLRVCGTLRACQAHAREHVRGLLDASEGAAVEGQIDSLEP